MITEPTTADSNPTKTRRAWKSPLGRSRRRASAGRAVSRGSHLDEAEMPTDYYNTVI